jgi:exopolysaccharide biosynthesis polyprenyl glycosylphosphotransferase
VVTFLALLPNAVILTGRAHGSRAGFFVAPAVGVVFAAVGAGLVPGPDAHPVALAGACVLGFLAPLLWRPWQDRWMEKRVERVSLLAPSVLAAADAIERLEVVPWIRVLSVLVPEGDAEVAGRLLKRPVARAPRGGPRLERRVIVSCPMRDPAVGRSIAELVARGHDLTSESATLRRAEGRVDVGRADPLNILLGRPRSRWLDASSRILDILGSLVLLMILSPVLIAVSIAVALSSGFPVFYKQLRVGRGGRPFHVVKFRSMRKDAEKLSGPVWATEEDPRITSVGRFLRRYRLDELPQLFNVLMGTMALVGPRPERPHFCDVLREQVPLFELRTIVRPGLTGWAQVRLAYGASSDDAAAKLAYDLYYVGHRSPWFDLAILVETARVVLTGEGAR